MSLNRPYPSSPQEASPHSLMGKPVGTAIAVFAQVFVFYPFDTVSKRLIKNKEPFTGTFAERYQTFNRAIFMNANHHFAQRFALLYSGVSAGIKYKLLQATYKFTGQDWTANLLKGTCKNNELQQALSGALVGVGEIFFCLPVDMVKVLQQTNPSLCKQSMWSLLKYEMQQGGIRQLYKGAGITALRNAPGSAAYFGVPPLVYNHVFHVAKKDASTTQQLVANVAGSICSLLASQAQEVIKTEKQSEQGKSTSALTIAKNIFEREGWRGFNKGLWVRILTQVPKLAGLLTFVDLFSHQVESSIASYEKRIKDYSMNKSLLFSSYQNNKKPQNKPAAECPFSQRLSCRN